MCMFYLQPRGAAPARAPTAGAAVSVCVQCLFPICIHIHVHPLMYIHIIFIIMDDMERSLSLQLYTNRFCLLIVAGMQKRLLPHTRRAQVPYRYTYRCTHADIHIHIQIYTHRFILLYIYICIYIYVPSRAFAIIVYVYFLFVGVAVYFPKQCLHFGGSYFGSK